MTLTDQDQALPKPCIKVARVREPAPDFSCAAVIQGQFEGMAPLVVVLDLADAQRREIA